MKAEGDARDDHAEARDCEQWLRRTLAAGPVAIAEVYRGGRDAGFSKDQLKRAKRRIGTVTRRDGFGPESKCAWALHAGAFGPDDSTLERPSCAEGALP